MATRAVRANVEGQPKAPAIECARTSEAGTSGYGIAHRIRRAGPMAGRDGVGQTGCPRLPA
jgi:hypothetical protein